MNRYVGTKKVNAFPITKIAYNQLRGWALPEGEDGTEKGYLVEYPDSVPNHPEFNGYISWSPKQVFEDAYSKYGELDFGKALSLMKEGLTVERVSGSKLMKAVSAVESGIKLSGDYIVNIDGTVYEPSQEDLLANDWGIVE